MSFGGGGSPKRPPPPPRLADVSIGESGIAEQSKRRRGSQTLISRGLGMTEDPRIIFPQLSTVLGGGR